VKTVVVAISLPEYGIDTQPDYEAIGAKIDRALEENFDGKEVALRAVSMAEHQECSMDEFVRIIIEKGTDRYDPSRKPPDDGHFDAYRPDMHASACTIEKGHTDEGTDIVQKFYENILLDRGYRLRVDIILVYDLHQLVRAEKVDPGKPGVRPALELYLFRFNDPANKPRALLGIVKLLK